MYVKFDGQTIYASGVYSGGTTKQLSILRLECINIGICVNMDSQVLDAANGSVPGHTIFDQIAIVDSTYSAPLTGNSYGAFISADRLTIMGNDFDNGDTGAHVVRVTYAAKSVISNNTLRRPATNNHVLKLHGPAWRILPSVVTAQPTGTAGLGIGAGISRWNVISDNIFSDSATPWTIAIQPTNNSRDERVQDIIFERNWITSGATNQVGLVVGATFVTVRNNLFDMTNSNNGDTRAVLVRQDGIEPAPDTVDFYNNTVYMGSAPANTSGGFQLAATASNTTLKNNLVYFPLGPANTTFNKFLYDLGTNTVTCASCNSSDSQVKNTAPLFTSVAPFNPANAKPTAGSYAIGGGASVPVAVPVWSDFFRVANPPHYIGAVSP